MRKILISISILSIYALSSCGGGEEKPESSITDKPEEVVKDTLKKETELPQEGLTAIALWSTTLRESPVTKNVSWVKGGSVAFGNKLELTGDTANEGNTSFSKVKIASGQEGWIKDYLIAKDAKVGVVVETASIYKNPDIMSLDRDEKLEVGTFVAVLNGKEDIGFLQFYGKEKKIRGWVKEGSGISTDDLDIEVGLLRNDALAEEDLAMKVMKIQEILDNPEYMSSKLYADLAAKVQKEESEEDVMEMDEDVEEYVEDIISEDEGL